MIQNPDGTTYKLPKSPLIKQRGIALKAVRVSKKLDETVGSPSASNAIRPRLNESYELSHANYESPDQSVILARNLS